MAVKIYINSVGFQLNDRISNRMGALAGIYNQFRLKPLGVSSFLDRLKPVLIDPAEYFIDRTYTILSLKFPLPLWGYTIIKYLFVGLHPTLLTFNPFRVY
ncbi:hypothetical protein VUJ46_22595 [Chryseobacterium sp. MYb264]|uniref:hypothetical protein n=1 Tax=Chryseobacterium sp. MYb264 TaxID=2745153 RepID=UPI002E0E9C35|nr:hypothetical protein VUJ46_22595 [Chryseobacterium sp. MYb264]